MQSRPTKGRMCALNNISGRRTNIFIWIIMETNGDSRIKRSMQWKKVKDFTVFTWINVAEVKDNS